MSRAKSASQLTNQGCPSAVAPYNRYPPARALSISLALAGMGHHVSAPACNLSTRTMEKHAYEAAIKLVNQDGRYVDAVLNLRQNKHLHALVELRLAELIKSVPGSSRLHVQPEKYGISNGRIDLAIYGEGRVVVHCELIASASNGHVFRDTTSLLGTTADTTLAILIDQEVDPSIARDYFRAIPRSRVPHIFLQRILLERYEASACAILAELIGDASYISGSIAADGFYCNASRSDLRAGDSFDIKYANLDVPTRLRVRLLSANDDPILLEDREFSASSGTFLVRIPSGAQLTRGQYSLQLLSASQRCSRRVYITASTSRPSLWCPPGQHIQGSSVEIRAEGFPPSTSGILSFFDQQEGAGHGVGKINIDSKGSGEASITIPGFSNRTPTGGYHRLVLQIDGAEANAYLEVIPSPHQPWQFLEAEYQKNDGYISCRLQRLEYRPGALRITCSLLALREGIRWQSISITGKSQQVASPFLFFTCLASPSFAGDVLSLGESTEKTGELYCSSRIPQPPAENHNGFLDVSIDYTFMAHHLRMNMSISVSADELAYLVNFITPPANHSLLVDRPE